jgi:hypothetical protein
MCNQVGGNDSLIFDGSSLALNGRGELIAQAASFAEDLVLVDPFPRPPIGRFLKTMIPRQPIAPWCWAPAITCASAASQGHRGLSGGIDSALVAAIAAEALGRRERDRRRHAQPLLFRGFHRRQPPSWPPTSASALKPSRIKSLFRGVHPRL